MLQPERTCHHPQQRKPQRLHPAILPEMGQVGSQIVAKFPRSSTLACSQTAVTSNELLPIQGTMTLYRRSPPGRPPNSLARRALRGVAVQPVDVLRRSLSRACRGQPAVPRPAGVVMGTQSTRTESAGLKSDTANQIVRGDGQPGQIMPRHPDDLSGDTGRHYQRLEARWCQRDESESSAAQRLGCCRSLG